MNPYVESLRPFSMCFVFLNVISPASVVFYFLLTEFSISSAASTASAYPSSCCSSSSPISKEVDFFALLNLLLPLNTGTCLTSVSVEDYPISELVYHTGLLFVLSV